MEIVKDLIFSPVKYCKYTKNPKFIGNTPKSEKLLSRKNYIIYESKNQNENILILAHIKIFDDFNKIKMLPIKFILLILKIQERITFYTQIGIIYYT